MIRVLHILNSLNAGGMETMIMNYYRAIDKNEIQFDFLVFSEKSFYDDEVEALGGKIYRIIPRRKNFIMNYKQLDDFFKIHVEYKIVQIHQGINYFAPLIKASKYGVPIRISHSHGMDPKKIKRQGIIFNLYTVPKIKKLATHFVACSDDSAKQIFTKNIYEKNEYLMIRNAIDTERFSSNAEIRNEYRRMLNLCDQFVIGHIGNFTKVKNHLFLINVFSYVVKQKPKSKLILIGEGKLMESIKEKVKELGLENNVLFLGLRKDVDKLIQAFDCFILPSIYEGLPVVAIEAQTAGKNCFLSDSITKDVKITDLITFLSIRNTPQYWAEKIVDSYNNGNKKITNYKGQVIECGYDISVESKKLQEYYIKLLK